MSFTQITEKNNLIPYVSTKQYGLGYIEYFTSDTDGSWTVPSGISAVRVRIFGAGAGNNGGGGGFTMGIIPVTPGSSISIGVAPSDTNTAGTSSFGSSLSVTGATTNGGAGGAGVGGTVNNTGGSGVNSSCGGGVASLFGNGGQGIGERDNSRNYATGTSGGGGVIGTNGGAGLTGAGGQVTGDSVNGPSASNAPAYEIKHIDHIGTGGGGAGGPSSSASGGHGFNGGGGGYYGNGGFPGGGGGNAGRGAGGLIIVEY